MMVIDEPFAAPELIDYLVQTKQPILANRMAEKIAAEHNVCVLDSNSFAQRINAGERLICTSENAFSWVAENVKREEIAKPVALFKDKVQMRELLSPMYPNLEYKEVSTNELELLRFENLKPPFVLKPTVGYCSAGVYVIESKNQWDAALADIEHNLPIWRSQYAESALKEDSFIIESYLDGDEIAIDAYFDEEGKAVVLDVLLHEFSNLSDTSDRLYMTGPSIIRQFEQPFTQWLNKVNKYVGAKNFPVHVETRVKNGVITPIEFNPLRFAGMCGTEIAYHAYGFHTYDYFLRGIKPNWDELLKGKEGKLFTMGYLLAPEKVVSGEKTFNYDVFLSHFSNVRAFYRFNPVETGGLGFIFAETPENDETERAFQRDVNFEEFCE